METHKKLVLGIFGFGVVGEGLYKVLNQTASLNATIKKVCIKNSYKKEMLLHNYLQQTKKYC